MIRLHFLLSPISIYWDVQYLKVSPNRPRYKLAIVLIHYKRRLCNQAFCCGRQRLEAGSRARSHTERHCNSFTPSNISTVIFASSVLEEQDVLQQGHCVQSWEICQHSLQRETQPSLQKFPANRDLPRPERGECAAIRDGNDRPCFQCVNFLFVNFEVFVGVAGMSCNWLFRCNIFRSSATVSLASVLVF